MNTTANTATGAPSPEEFAKAQEVFALKGHQLIQGSSLPRSSSNYLLICWGWSLHIDRWAEVLEILSQTGGAHE